jgi:putative heme degradation protein
MSDNHLTTLRENTLKDDITTSEAELHIGNDHIKDAWQELQDLKRKINVRKQEAIQAINDEFNAELTSLTDNYTFLLTLTR